MPVAQTYPTERPQQANLLAQYELLQRLGGGERASVHLARDRVLQQRVAIKLFRDAWSRDPDRIAQLYGLARGAAALDPARIAAVYDHGTAWHAAFMTSEYIPGRDLAELLPVGEVLPPRRAAAIVAQILEALIVTHEAGLIHGDLHPQNVRLRGDSDAVALTDFGTASVFPLSDDDDHGPYRAPELSSAILTPMTDIYAVGALLRALLLPVEHPGASAQARALTARLLAVAARALSPVPTDRYPTAAAMRDAVLAVTGPLALPAAPLVATAATALAPPAPLRPQIGTRSGRRGRYGALALAGLLVLGGIAGAGAFLHERQTTPLASPTALVAAQPSAAPSVAPTVAPTALAGGAPAPTAAPSVPVVVPATAAVAEAAPTVAPSAAPSSTTAPAASSAPTVAAAVPSAAPAATASAPTAASAAVAPTNSTPLGYSATFGPKLLTGAYRRDDGTLYGRQNAALYSVGTGYETGSLTFTVAQTPTVPVSLVLTGLDDELRGKNRLVVTINGTTVFDAPDTFPNTPASDHGVGGEDRYWGEMAIPIPVGVLQVGENTLTLTNGAPGGELGTPYILINAIQFAEPPTK